MLNCGELNMSKLSRFELIAILKTDVALAVRCTPYLFFQQLSLKDSNRYL